LLSLLNKYQKSIIIALILTKAPCRDFEMLKRNTSFKTNGLDTNAILMKLGAEHQGKPDLANK